MDEVHARRVRAPPLARRLGASGRSRYTRSRLVERIPRHAVLPARSAALGMVLSRHRAHAGVPGAFTVRRRCHPISVPPLRIAERGSGGEVLRIRAGRVHPVTAPPLEDGAVLVDANGRIAAVGPNNRVAEPAGANALHFPDAELMPGLVNCHTHLELTYLGGGAKHDEPEFLKWIRRIRELKDTTGAEAFHEAAVAGIRDCWARGVTCIAETGSTGAVLRALHDLGGRGIVYQEVFGPDPAQCSGAMAELESTTRALRRLETAQLRLGVSPHAPYTGSALVYGAVAQLARVQRLPAGVHVGERKEETAFVRHLDGPC